MSEGSESQKLDIKVKKETDKEKGEKEDEEETSEQVRPQVYSRVGVRSLQIRFFPFGTFYLRRCPLNNDRIRKVNVYTSYRVF